MNISWIALQESLQNSVVQVVAQITPLDWIEPYRSTRQFENRGTGFFIDESGYLITNAHVVDEAAMVWIHLPALGKKTVFVDIVGFCPELDLALLKVRDADLAVLHATLTQIVSLPLGDSDKVERTQEVLMLGYPLGQSMMKSSIGTVSGREFLDGHSLIQITARIHAGNSGGPLLNGDGNVIGIALANVTKKPSIGYALAINEVKIMLDDLYKQPLVRKEPLGMQYNYASREHAVSLGNPVPAGIFINKVFKDKLFEVLGVRAGDMLYTFNGIAVDAYGDMSVSWSHDKVNIFQVASRLSLGDPMSIVVYREGQKVELSGTFHHTPCYPIRRFYPPYEAVDYEIIGGLVIMELTANHITVLGKRWPRLLAYTVEENMMESALVITHIFPGSCMYQMRSLAPGFVIHSLNNSSVTTLADFRKAMFEGIESDLFVLEACEGARVVASLKALLHDEKKLSKQYAYPLTHSSMAILDRYAQNDETDNQKTT
jgi:S1-C subfamily serine protease